MGIYDNSQISVYLDGKHIIEKTFIKTKNKNIIYKVTISARIRRRNEQGFVGVGTPKWIKTSSVGNYRDSEDNNKNNKDKVLSILCEAKKIGLVGKHSGSKPLKRIKSNIRHFHIATKLYNDYVKFLKEKQA